LMASTRYSAEHVCGLGVVRPGGLFPDCASLPANRFLIM
jgi:hypothetical protein